MTNIQHNATEFRNAITAFCQGLRAESAAILQTCAAFEKLQGYLSVIATQDHAPTLMHDHKQHHTVQMAMLRTVVAINEISEAHDDASLAFATLDPIAATFAMQYLGIDTPYHNDDDDDDTP